MKYSKSGWDPKKCTCHEVSATRPPHAVPPNTDKSYLSPNTHTPMTLLFDSRCNWTVLNSVWRSWAQLNLSHVFASITLCLGSILSQMYDYITGWSCVKKTKQKATVILLNIMYVVFIDIFVVSSEITA